MAKYCQCPRALSRAGLSMIGRDRDGHWIVRGPHDAYGGLFVSRTQALKFALFENGNRPHAVILVPGTLELGV